MTDWLPALLPSTALAAIFLFLLKEFLEGIRRSRAKNRQIEAFKTLLARECELNRWAVCSLNDALKEMDGDSEENLATDYAIERSKSGKVFFRSDDGSAWPLPEARSDLMSEIMFDVATLDKSLFALLQNAYDSVLELKHVRQSLMDFLETDNENEKLHLAGFPDYGLRELKDVQVSLEELYLECTGQKLDKGRVR